LYIFICLKKILILKNWICNTNTNNDDNYDFAIVYYALLKEDKKTIKYNINIGSNNMISNFYFKFQTIIHISIFLGLKDIFLDIIQIGQNISKTIMNEIDDT